jgi:hypothetical protein
MISDLEDGVSHLRTKEIEPVSLDAVLISLPHPYKVIMKMSRYKRLCFEYL